MTTTDDKVGRRSDQWPRCSLREISESIDYGVSESASFDIESPKLLRITDIQRGKVDWASVPGCRWTIEEARSKALADGDIVVARTGGTVGKSFLVRRPPLGLHASYLVRVRLNATANPEFVYAFLQSDDYWRQLYSHSRGGAQPNVNATLLGSISLPLPSPSEQKRVSAMLNEQMAQAQIVRDRIFAASADSRVACDRASLNAILGELDGAPRAKLGDVLMGIEAGRSAQTLERPPKAGERAVLKVSAMSWDRFDPEEAKALPPGYVPPESHFVRKGDLLMSRANTKELVGAAVLVEHDYPDLVLSDKSLRLVTDETRILPEYLLAALRLPEARAFIEDKATGSSSSMRNISQGLIRQIPLPIPSLATQRSIAAKLSAIAVVRASLVKAFDEQLSAASVLPSAYLRRAFAVKPESAFAQFR